MAKISRGLRTWNRYFYKCEKCGAEDSSVQLNDTQPPAIINCWKCHAGQGKEQAECLMNRFGMILLNKEPESHGEAWAGM